MVVYHPDLQRHSLLRPADWRWQRAQWLLAHHRYYSRRRDDEQTGRAVNYIRKLGRCRRGVPSPGLLRRFADVHAARLLYEDESATQLLVQARLLARQASDEIARRTGVPESVIDVYEALFFHCRDRINARDWVLLQAIGKGACDQREPRAAAAFKRFAYHGGHLVLDAVAPYLVSGKDLFDPPLDLSTPAGRREQTIRLAVATELLPNDAKTNAKLSKVMLILAETTRKMPVGHAPVSLLAQNVDSMLKELAAEALSRVPDKQETLCFPEPASNSGKVA